MWVIRAGQNAIYYEKFIMSSKVFLPWDGYKIDLSNLSSRNDFRQTVVREKKIDNRTSISNWAGQLYSFSKEIEVGDYVLIPSKASNTFSLARINGDYEYDENSNDGLYHSRDIVVLVREIPKRVFPQDIVYSLGAYRTIFRAKQEDRILAIIEEWKRSNT